MRCSRSRNYLLTIISPRATFPLTSFANLVILAFDATKRSLILTKDLTVILCQRRNDLSIIYDINRRRTLFNNDEYIDADSMYVFIVISHYASTNSVRQVTQREASIYASIYACHCMMIRKYAGITFPES